MKEYTQNKQTLKDPTTDGLGWIPLPKLQKFAGLAGQVATTSGIHDNKHSPELHHERSSLTSAQVTLATPKKEKTRPGSGTSH